MGCCFSSSAAAGVRSPTAKVINFDGSLMEYSHPLKVSHILGHNHPSFFLCNADGLIYGQFIQALGSDRLIEPGQLYFMLPAAKLEYRLGAAEMAALAIRASSAFAAETMAMATARRRQRNRRREINVEVMPVVETMDVNSYRRINEASVGGWKYGWGEKKRVGVEKRSSKARLSAIVEIAE